MRHTLANIAVWLILLAMVGSFLLVQVRIHRGIYGESDSRAYLTLANSLS
jgi:hypothetical protein